MNITKSQGFHRKLSHHNVEESMEFFEFTCNANWFILYWPFTRPKCIGNRCILSFDCHGNRCGVNNFTQNMAYSERPEFWLYRDMWLSVSVVLFFIQSILYEALVSELRPQIALTTWVGSWATMIASLGIMRFVNGYKFLFDPPEAGTWAAFPRS